MVGGQRGWVAEMGGCAAGWAHTLEKSGSEFAKISIHSLTLVEMCLKGVFSEVRLITCNAKITHSSDANP